MPSDSDNPHNPQAKSPNLRRVPPPDWLATAIRGKGNALVANVHNAALFLECFPELEPQLYFQFDELRHSVVCFDKWGHPPRVVTDCDEAVCRRWLEQQGFKRIPSETVRNAILIVAQKRAFNPLQQHLAGLAWDGERRLEAWLSSYLGAANSDYVSTVGILFLRSMIARALWPGRKADYMLVLEGPQRREKSTACEILAGEEYFSDTMPDLAGDRVRLAMHLRGKWLVEVSELHAFNRAEASLLKSFLSTRREIFTPKFGRYEVTEPRSCLFVGTTNKATYLRDETGGSRFWPVRIGLIDLDALRRDRNQLLAEAYHQVVKLKSPWWPNHDFEDTVIAPHQDARYEGDEWQAAIADWDFAIPQFDSDGKPVGRLKLDKPFWIVDIARGALDAKIDRLSRHDQLRLTSTLEFMGWHRAPRVAKGIPWMPPD